VVAATPPWTTHARRPLHRIRKGSISMNDFIIASAFGDAGTKVIGFLTEVRPALIAMIIFGAALGVVFDRGHKGAILGSAVLAIILLMGFTTLGAQI